MMKLNSKLIGAIAFSLLSTTAFTQDWLVGGNNLLQMGGNPPILGTMAGNNQPLNLYTNGIQRMFINDNTGPTAGFIGIGNNFNTPLQRLHIVGDINLQTNIFQKTANNDGYRINNQTVLAVKNSNNLFVGWNAGASWVNSGVAQNTFVGNNSGQNNTTGFHNTFLGFESGVNNNTGFRNVMIGYQAGLNNVGAGGIAGNRNVFIGSSSGFNNTGGGLNTFVGELAGWANTTGARNTYVGALTARTGTSTGSENSFFGQDAGRTITSGSRNTISGASAAEFITDSRWNTISGYFAARDIVNSDNNVIQGYQTAENITNSNNNIVSGFQSGFAINGGGRNIVSGDRAGQNLLNSSNNIIQGTRAAGTFATGSNNIFIGRAVAQNAGNGDNNVALGFLASQNVAGGTNNITMGTQSGQNAGNGNNNLYLGTRSGRNNTGNNNTFIGFRAGNPAGATNLTNATGLGSLAIPTGNNEMILGDNNVNVGIGLSNDANGPNNKLEINESANNDLTNNGNGGTGFSGLRFRDLTSNSTPNTTNPGAGVLALNADGDVIYVQEPTGTGGGNVLADNGVSIDPANANNVQLGQFMPNTSVPTFAGIGQLLNDREVPMNDNNMIFSGFDNALENSFAIGNFNTTRAKLNVFSSAKRYGIYTKMNDLSFPLGDMYGQRIDIETTTVGTVQGSQINIVSGANTNTASGIVMDVAGGSTHNYGIDGIVDNVAGNAITNNGSRFVVSGGDFNTGYIALVNGDLQRNYGYTATLTGASTFESVGVRADVSEGLNRNWGIVSETNADGVSNRAVYGRLIGGDLSNGQGGTAGWFESTQSANTGSQLFGVRGLAFGGGPNASNYGVYGEANGGGTNVAGYFAGTLVQGGSPIPSDIQFKENISGLSNAQAIIDSLNPVTFNYKTTGNATYLNFESGAQIGFIAQEVEQILPEVVLDVKHPEQLNSDGTLHSPGFDYKTVDYSKIVPVLVADAQQKNATIDSLENVNSSQDSIITDLNNRLTNLENCLSNLMPTLCQMNNEVIEENSQKTQEDLRNIINVELSDANNLVLDQNVPNPFAEQTVINYVIPETVKRAQIHFYNAAGQLIQSVEINERGSGRLNVFGEDLSSGIYTYTLVADGLIVATKKMQKMHY